MDNFISNDSIKIFIITHIILLGCVFFIVYFKDKISVYLNIIDFPDHHIKVHQLPTPRLGGVMLIFYILPALLINYHITSNELKNLIITLSLCIVFFSIGLVDDRKTLSATNKSLTLLIMLLLIIPLSDELIIKQINFKNLNFSINLLHASIFFTIFSIFALYNAYNFSDGINGVAATLGIFWIIFVIIKSENYTNLYYQAILVSLIIVLYFNMKRKLFLGNSGTNLFSIIISLILIQEYKNNNIYCDEIFFILFLPGMDMIRLSAQRIISNKSPFLGDRQHFHHLLGTVIKEKYIFLFYIFISITPIAIYNFFINNFYIVFALSIVLYFTLFFLLHRLQKIS